MEGIFKKNTLTDKKEIQKNDLFSKFSKLKKQINEKIERNRNANKNSGDFKKK